MCKPSVLQDRQLVEAFVRRIEIEPETKTGTIVLVPDLKDALDYISTRRPIGDGMGSRVERVGFRWRRGDVKAVA